VANREPFQARWWRGLLDAAGLFLVLYAGMNLSGILEMTTGVEGGLSTAVLAFSVFVIAGSASSRLLCTSYVWFGVFMVAYIFGGLVPPVMKGDLDVPRLIQYVGTFIYCSAVYFFIMQRGSFRLDLILNVLQIVFLINCVAALFSKSLSEYFGYSISLERATGFFYNPDETAVMALYFMVLIVTSASRASVATGSKLFLAALALILTLSKNGYLLFFVLGVAYLVARRFYGKLAVALASLLMLFPLIGPIVENNPYNLGDDQRLRIEQVLDIVSGEVDNKTTTGRLDLWSLGLERIGNTFPFGGGIGSFHRMEGAQTDVNGDWLGVHNAFLMVLGESGLVPLLALLAFLFVLASSCLASSRRLAAVGILIVLLGDMMVTHGVFVIRLHNLMLVILVVISSGAAEDIPSLRPSQITPGRLTRPSVLSNERNGAANLLD
jgi:O-antigen ligase